MEPIVLVADCAPAGEACLQAVDLAKATGAPLIAVASVHATFPTAGFRSQGYSGVAAQVERVKQVRAQEALASVAAEASGAGVECTTMVSSGADADAIRDVAREAGARMIVVASRCRVASGLLESAPCPVLVV
jgi:nucleotide-binding universal stress UspA family protein